MAPIPSTSTAIPMESSRQINLVENAKPTGDRGVPSAWIDDRVLAITDMVSDTMIGLVATHPMVIGKQLHHRHVRA